MHEQVMAPTMFTIQYFQGNMHTSNREKNKIIFKRTRLTRTLDLTPAYTQKLFRVTIPLSLRICMSFEISHWDYYDHERVIHYYESTPLKI